MPNQEINKTKYREFYQLLFHQSDHFWGRFVLHFGMTTKMYPSLCNILKVNYDQQFLHQKELHHGIFKNEHENIYYLFHHLLSLFL